MDSFKVYLPSNASAGIFPNNTPSNYQTQFSDPIQLQGEWEAGLESIHYSTKIGDEEESVQLNLAVEAQNKIYVTSRYPYKYRITEDGKWPVQFLDVYPKNIVTDPSDREGVIRCLNTINREILEFGEKSDVFSFKVEGEKTVFIGETNGILVATTTNMSRYLGFGWTHIFSGRTNISGELKRRIPKSFVRDDYHVKIIDTNVLQKVGRVVIKESGRIFPDPKRQLKEVWTKELKNYDIKVRFSKSGKLIIDNFNPLVTIRLSPDFSKTFDIAEAIFSSNTEWALVKFDSKKLYEKDLWYVDLYYNNIDHFLKIGLHDISIGFTPRRYHDVHHIIPTINSLTEAKLKETLASTYNDDFHKCELSFFKNHTQLDVGRWVSLTISDNLSFLLGFDKAKFEAGNYLSKRLPATLEQREQHLFVLTDFIQSSSYGDVKMDILQEFVHEGNSIEQRIIEKRFHPISYNPVKCSYIENIQIQLVNEIFKPIYIDNSKTIVILHFRKR